MLWLTSASWWRKRKFICSKSSRAPKKKAGAVILYPAFAFSFLMKSDYFCHMKSFKDLMERSAFGVCSYLGDKMGLASARVRMYFIYLSFATLGSPIIIYLFVAFWLNIKKYIKNNRNFIWGWIAQSANTPMACQFIKVWQNGFYRFPLWFFSRVVCPWQAITQDAPSAKRTGCISAPATSTAHHIKKRKLVFSQLERLRMLKNSLLGQTVRCSFSGAFQTDSI